MFRPLARQNNFDLIRLYAALNVVFSHSLTHLRLPGRPLWDWALVAAPGVPIFFMISGFLITESFLRSPSLIRFAWKRALRIYPLLAVNIIVLEMLVIATGGTSPLQHMGEFLRFLFVYVASGSDHLAAFVTGYHPGWRSNFFPYYPSGVLWTLSVELSFYALIAIVLAVLVRFSRVGGVLVAATIAGSFALALGINIRDSGWLELYALPYLWIFGIGIVARLLWDRICFLFYGTFTLWLIGYAALTALLYAFGQPLLLDFKRLDLCIAAKMVALGGAMLSAAYTAPGFAERLLRGNDFSYGIYLWHMLVVTTMLGLGFSGQWWLWPLVLVCSLALAAASWLWIESPALRMKNWRTGTRPIGRAMPYDTPPGK